MGAGPTASYVGFHASTSDRWIGNLQILDKTYSASFLKEMALTRLLEVENYDIHG